MLTLIAMVAPALAAPEIGAILRSDVVADVAHDRRASNGVDLAEDVASLHSWARMFARDETSRGDTWFLEARFQHHLLVGHDVQAWYELGVGETGWDGRLGGANSPARLRAGALRQRWGKTDLLPVLDVLNPTDARIGPLVPTDHRKLPVPMAVLTLGKGALRSETTAIPFAAADRLWLRDTDWSLLRQDMVRDLLVNDIRAPGGWLSEADVDVQNSVSAALDGAIDNIEHLDPSLRRGQDAATNADGLPQAFVGNGQLAQRFEITGRGFDLAVMGGLLRSTFPEAILDPSLQVLLREQRLPEDLDALRATQAEVVDGTSLNVRWPRTGLVGVEGSGLVGDLQVRAEVGYWTDRVVRMPFGDSTTVPQLAGAVGLDLVRGTSFQATVEARWQHLIDPPARLVFARPDQIQIALGIRAAVLAERLQLTLGGAYDASFREIFVRPSIAWRVSDHVQLEIGGIILEGFETAPPAGLLEALVYEGGPASYWSQNDSATLSVSWFL